MMVAAFLRPVANNYMMSMLPSGCRFRAPLVKKKAYRNSFIPIAIF